jgi:rRNA-processing protein FCF1
METLRKIAIDTNMLLGIETLKINPFEQLTTTFGKIEFGIPESVYTELEQHANKKAVTTAKLVLEQEKTKTVKTHAKNADDALLELADKGYTVATNDKALRKKIKDTGYHCIYLRKKQVLEIG